MRPVRQAAARAATFGAIVACVAMAALATSCSNDPSNPLAVTNQAPTVQIVAAPIDTNAVCTPDAARSCYSITLNWYGQDPDGRVDHFLFAIDPPDVGDTAWVSTTDKERRLVFDAPKQSPYADSLTILRGFHTFVIAAVDEKGLMGPRAFRSFFSFTKAPTINITAPRPRNDERLMPPSIRLTWRGVDDDGVFTSKPIRYKYLLVGPGNSDVLGPEGIDGVTSDPGKLRRLFAPDFPSTDSQGRPLWTTVGGETTTVQFTNLLPSAHYLFIVVAFDEAGAYSPTFTLDSNVLKFQVGYAASLGPTITMFNEFFFFRFSPGYHPEPIYALYIEVPANQPVTFNWFAEPPQGANIRGYRWMLDGDVFDETPRSDENTDLRHWSTASVNTITASVGPFGPGEHDFYLEAEDNTGFKSLATVHFTVVEPTFANPLLFVDDTRLNPDGFLAGGGYLGPQGAWPVAAEADTFFHAIGGQPWKAYPQGTLSPEGLLHGYAYDTLGTRFGILNAGVPLAVLGRYQRVIWMTDNRGAGYSQDGINPSTPVTALRFGAAPGHLNTIAAYLRQGGEAWMCGGGGALATSIPYNARGNDQLGVFTFEHFERPSGTAVNSREVAPGRFMYDIAKWQSRYKCPASVSGNITRSVGRFAVNPADPTSPPLPGHPYNGLPPVLSLRDPGSDPIPPLREFSQSEFYNQSFPAEALCEVGDGNSYFEPVLGDPNDLKIDDFEDTEAAIKGRWVRSDTLTTQVTQIAVPGGGDPRANGKAMQVATQGGGVSNGATFTQTFASIRDYSGIRFMRVSVLQDQPVANVQWRIRMIDAGGRSTSALLKVTKTGSFQDLVIDPRDFTDDTTNPIRMATIKAVQLQVDRSTVAAATAFDRIDISSQTLASALDTLMAAPGGGGLPIVTINATMTYYRGKDLIKPFLFSGFEIYGFKRTQCKQLVDFVLHNLWGMNRVTGPDFPGPGSANVITGRVVSTPAARMAAPARSLDTRGPSQRESGRAGKGVRSARSTARPATGG